MLNFNGVMIGTENVDKLVSFYKEVFEGDPSWKSDDGKFAGWQAGNGWLMIGFHDKVKGTSPNPERLILGLETPKVEEEFQRIKEVDGAAVIAKPYEPKGADGMQLATIADPDGNYLQLASPMDLPS